MRCGKDRSSRPAFLCDGSSFFRPLAVYRAEILRFVTRFASLSLDAAKSSSQIHMIRFTLCWLGYAGVPGWVDWSEASDARVQIVS